MIIYFIIDELNKNYVRRTDEWNENKQNVDFVRQSIEYSHMTAYTK